MKKGIEYEIFVRGIFQSILNQTSVKNVEVRHDIELAGLTSKHKVDIYWKFIVGGIEYETIVQAKDWRTRVSKGQLMEFKGVLDDLPGQVRGVFITKTGYQRGALEVAKGYGILLYELNEFRAKPITMSLLGFARGEILQEPKFDLNGNVSFIFQTTIYEAKYEALRLIADEAWITSQLQSSQEDMMQQFSPTNIVKTKEHYIAFFNAVGEIVTDHTKIVKQFVGLLQKEKIFSKSMRHNFVDSTFIQLQSNRQMVKVLSLAVDVEMVEKEKIQNYMTLPNISLFVLKNLADGSEKLVGKNKI